jgi:hypothetical protein
MAPSGRTTIATMSLSPLSSPVVLDARLSDEKLAELLAHQAEYPERLVPLARLCSAREEISKAVVVGVHPPIHYLHRRAHRAHVVDSCATLGGLRLRSDSRPRKVSMGPISI